MSPVVNLAVTKAWSPLELPWPALQHCSTASQSWGSYTQSAHSATPHCYCYRTSTGHSITSNKPHCSALSMGFWSPEKFVPAIVHIFGIAVGTRPPQSWDIYFWAQSECQLSWARTRSQLTNSCLISGSGLNFSVCRIMVMWSLSVSTQWGSHFCRSIWQTSIEIFSFIYVFNEMQNFPHSQFYRHIFTTSKRKSMISDMFNIIWTNFDTSSACKLHGLYWLYLNKRIFSYCKH